MIEHINRKTEQGIKQNENLAGELDFPTSEQECMNSSCHIYLSFLLPSKCFVTIVRYTEILTLVSDRFY